MAHVVGGNYATTSQRGFANGYVVELTASTGVQQEIMDPAVSKPREAIARWQAAKPRQPAAA